MIRTEDVTLEDGTEYRLILEIVEHARLRWAGEEAAHALIRYGGVTHYVGKERSKTAIADLRARAGALALALAARPLLPVGGSPDPDAGTGFDLSDWR